MLPIFATCALQNSIQKLCAGFCSLSRSVMVEILFGNGEKSARMTCLFPVVRKLAKKVYCNLRTKAHISNYNRPFSNGMRMPFLRCAQRIFALCATKDSSDGLGNGCVRRNAGLKYGFQRVFELRLWHAAYNCVGQLAVLEIQHCGY